MDPLYFEIIVRAEPDGVSLQTIRIRIETSDLGVHAHVDDSGADIVAETASRAIERILVGEYAELHGIELK